MHSIKVDELKEKLFKYSSDEFEGRGTPSKGQELAINYLANHYKSIGIPSIKKDTYFQEVPLQFEEKPDIKLSISGNLIIICGHYKGIGHRVRDHIVTKEISIGDYVVSGGELPAAVLCDSIIRLQPGTLGDESSALTDTFQDSLVSPTIYTRPEVYKGLKVPKVLLSGNKKDIQEWNDKKSIERTKLLRPNLFDYE